MNKQTKDSKRVKQMIIFQKYLASSFLITIHDIKRQGFIAKIPVLSTDINIVKYSILKIQTNV